MAIGRHRAADLEHLFQHVAAGVFQVDQDDVGIERIDPRQQALHLADMHDAGETGLPQPLLQDRGRIGLSSTITIFGEDSALIGQLLTRQGFHSTSEVRQSLVIVSDWD